MSRHRFRSQPTLQRSGGRWSSAVIGITLLALIAIGMGALIGELTRGADLAPAGRYPAGPIDEPATFAAAPPAPQAQPAPAAPRANVLEARSVSGGVLTKSARQPRKSRPQTFPAAGTASPQEGWEQQRQEYERARAAYDADERSAGYQWAQQNRIRIVRYCQVASQRTPAFVEGCLNYLAARRTGGSPKPRDAPSALAQDHG